MWERERRFLSGYDFHPFAKDADREGLGLHSRAIQAIAEEYASRRKQARKVTLRWQASCGARHLLDWIPVRGNAIRYRIGHLLIGKMVLSLRDVESRSLPETLAEPQYWSARGVVSGLSTLTDHLFSAALSATSPILNAGRMTVDIEQSETKMRESHLNL